MGKPLEQLGRMLKPQDLIIGATTGRVTLITPLNVRISDAIIAKPPRLFYLKGMTFEIGDEVLVISSSDNQRFYVVGKVVRA